LKTGRAQKLLLKAKTGSRKTGEQICPEGSNDPGQLMEITRLAARDAVTIIFTTDPGLQELGGVACVLRDDAENLAHHKPIHRGTLQLVA
jgi:hypothetical protein